MRKIILALYFLPLCIAIYPQNPEWINYTSPNVNAVAVEGNYIWAGGCGLTRINKTTGEKVFYNKANSGLPDNNVCSLAIDGNGNKWIGTYCGLAKFDAVGVWVVYNNSNSGLPEL